MTMDPEFCFLFGCLSEGKIALNFCLLFYSLSEEAIPFPFFA